MTTNQKNKSGIKSLSLDLFLLCLFLAAVWLVAALLPKGDGLVCVRQYLGGKVISEAWTTNAYVPPVNLRQSDYIVLQVLHNLTNTPTGRAARSAVAP